MLAVVLQGFHNGGLEVVNGHKVGEEGQNVLDLDGGTLRQELHRLQ